MSPRLAKRAELDKGTTHRLASKLVELGYLRRDDDGKFMLGLHVLDLGFSYLASLDLRTQALPEMRRLHEEFDGAITLAILDGTEIVYVERGLAERFAGEHARRYRRTAPGILHRDGQGHSCGIAGRPRSRHC